MTGAAAAPAGGAHPSLASLFGVPGAARFLHEYWPERHFVVHRAPATLPAVLRSPALGGIEALSRHYHGPVTFGRGTRDARTASADAEPTQLLRMGLTVYLPDIGECVPGLPGWLAALEREIGLPPGCTRIGAFASPPGDGVACHFDADDVISIQLHGTKVFHVAPVADLRYPVGQQFGPGMLPGDDLYAQAGAGFPSPDGLPFERIEMRAGSVLFLPRGTWHRTEADEASFSVSIGVRAPAALDRLLAQLREVLLQDPEWRRPLYEAHRLDAAGEALTARVDGLLAGLPSVLRRITGRSLVRQDLPGSPARYQRVPLARMEWRAAGDRLRLNVWAPDADWNACLTVDTEVPGHLAALLDWITRRDAAYGAEVLAGRFKAIPAADRDQLVELLARAGYLRRLPFPSLAGDPA